MFIIPAKERKLAGVIFSDVFINFPIKGDFTMIYQDNFKNGLILQHFQTIRKELIRLTKRQKKDV